LKFDLFISKIHKNRQKIQFFSHQTKGNIIISSNQRGQVSFSNGVGFTAILRFWTKKGKMA